MLEYLWKRDQDAIAGLIFEFGMKLLGMIECGKTSLPPVLLMELLHKKIAYPVSKYLRIMAIGQLCIAFTLLLWHFSQPFVGDLFRTKAQLLVLEEVMGAVPAVPSEERILMAKKNKARYLALSESNRSLIAKGYARAQEQKKRSFSKKLKSSFDQISKQLPLFEQAWLILSIIVPILLLKQVEGSRLAVWLIPLISFMYTIDNQTNGVMPKPSMHEMLFPKEELLISQYMNEPLSENIVGQHTQLKGAWQLYLIDHWAKQVPSKNLQEYLEQVEIGGYAFNVARAIAIVQAGKLEQSTGHYKDPSVLVYGILIWNFFFALSTLSPKLCFRKRYFSGSKQLKKTTK